MKLMLASVVLFSAVFSSMVWASDESMTEQELVGKEFVDGAKLTFSNIILEQSFDEGDAISYVAYRDSGKPVVTKSDFCAIIAARKKDASERTKTISIKGARILTLNSVRRSDIVDATRFPPADGVDWIESELSTASKYRVMIRCMKNGIKSLTPEKLKKHFGTDVTIPRDAVKGEAAPNPDSNEEVRLKSSTGVG